MPSSSQIKKAGRVIRRYHRGEASEETYLAALDIIGEYRASFSLPLTKVNNGLRGFLNTLEIDAQVTQRLKRMDTIVEKLSKRETSLSLDKMADIAGCRVVLEDDDIGDLRRVEAWITYRWADAVFAVKDYVEHPRSSGYRAVHIIVRRDGRPVEIQVRTARMHAWAQFVEAMSAAMGQNYKQDKGDSVVQDFGRAMSKAYQAMDGLYELTPSDVADLRSLQDSLGDMLNETDRPEEA